MSTITVVTCDGDATQFEGASAWHTDDERQLHIIGANKTGNVATFAANVWRNVSKS